MEGQSGGLAAGILAKLGVPADAEAVWRALVAAPSSSYREIADRTGIAIERIDHVNEWLLEARLVRRGESASGLVAIEPTLAIETHIARSERQLAERAEELATIRAQIPDIAREYERGRADDGELVGFEIIVDVNDIRRQIDLAADRERSDNRYLSHTITLESLEAARSTDLRALARGIRQRSIVSAEALNEPNVYTGFEARAMRGELVRTLPQVPTQMLIFDRDLAVLAVDPNQHELGAVFVRVPSVVETLVYLFDHLWSEAKPVFGAPADQLAPSGRRAKVLELMAVGTKDERIARTLRVGVRTIRRDVAELKSTLGVTSRPEIPAAAMVKGWL
jgi:sugar-specific transcriptional regulator TrmB/DNA-binding CsgD family transcriptional regulator